MVSRAVRRLLRTDADPRTGIIAVVFVAIMRVVLETNRASESAFAPAGLAVAEQLAFYAATFWVFVVALRLTLPPDRVRGVPHLVAIGLLFGLIPPLLGLVPQLDGENLQQVAGWHWTLHAPGRQALAETLTLWASILASGLFTRAVAGSWLRAGGAVALSWMGLAWITVVLPSMLAAPSASDAWRMQVALAITCLLLVLASHRRVIGQLARRAVAALPFVAIVAFGSWLVGAPAPQVVARTSLAWCLLAVPSGKSGISSPGANEGPVSAHTELSAWCLALSLLLLFGLAFHDTTLAVSGSTLLVLRVASSTIPSEARTAPATQWVTNGMTALCALLLATMPSP